MSDVLNSERPIPYDRRRRTYVVDTFGTELSNLWLDADGRPTTPERGTKTRAVRAEGFIVLQRGGLSVKRTAELIPEGQLSDFDRRVLALKMIEEATRLSWRTAELIEQAVAMDSSDEMIAQATEEVKKALELVTQVNRLRGLTTPVS